MMTCKDDKETIVSVDRVIESLADWRSRSPGKVGSAIHAAGLVPGVLLALLLAINPLGAMAGTEICQSGLPESISVHCGAAPSATFDRNDRLWVAFVQDRQVFVSHSQDLGQTFSVPVAVNPVPEDAEFNGENRPKILVDSDATIYVSWTLKTSPRFTGEIRFSRSVDGGRTFSSPITVNDDGLFTGHRFESLFQTASGLLYLVWIDKRDLEASISRDEDYVGAAVYYAVSHDQGATFSGNYRVSNHSCECCRIGMAPRGPDEVVIFWRQIFGADTRDHAIATLTPNGEVRGLNRATYDEWHINACPHHGPTMTDSESSDSYHLSWFSNGDRHQGIYYGRYDMDQQETVNLLQVDASPGAGHPFLQTYNGRLYLVWKGYQDGSSLIRMMTSTDNGASWSEPETLAATTRGSDYPLIVANEKGLYLSWLSEESGYLFKKISGATETDKGNTYDAE